MLNRILGKMTDIPTLLASAIVALLIFAMLERNTFGIRQLIGGTPKNG